MLNSITSNDRLEIAKCLNRFYHNGLISFKEVFLIPSEDRIKGLCAVYGQKQIHSVLGAAISNALGLIENNLTGEAVFEISAEILNDNSDNLSIEDVMIFLKQLTGGKYTVYGKLDMIKFLECFEKYRDDRWSEALNIRYEQDHRLNSLGPSDRECDNEAPEVDANRLAMKEYMKMKKD